MCIVTCPLCVRLAHQVMVLLQVQHKAALLLPVHRLAGHRARAHRHFEVFGCCNARSFSRSEVSGKTVFRVVYAMWRPAAINRGTPELDKGTRGVMVIASDFDLRKWVPPLLDRHAI